MFISWMTFSEILQPFLLPSAVRLKSPISKVPLIEAKIIGALTQSVLVIHSKSFPGPWLLRQEMNKS